MKLFIKIMPLFLIIALVGCGIKVGTNEYKSVQEKLMNMESYYAEINVKYISNKGENEYDVIQKIKKDGRYIMETTSPEKVKGNVILYDGSMIWQYNPQVDSKISVKDKERMERKQISIFTFLENHVKSTDISVETANTDEGIYTILEAQIPSGNKYFETEKLWINNETQNPEKLIIYDEDGKERVVVTYKNFEYNPKLEDSLFNIENIANSQQN